MINCIDVFTWYFVHQFIGKLHRHIVQLQVSEGTAVKRLTESQKKVTKLEAMVLRLEQRLDDKDQTIYHNRTEAQNKAKHLKRNLQVCIIKMHIPDKMYSVEGIFFVFCIDINLSEIFVYCYFWQVLLTEINFSFSVCWQKNLQGNIYLQ